MLNNMVRCNNVKLLRVGFSVALQCSVIDRKALLLSRLCCIFAWLYALRYCAEFLANASVRLRNQRLVCACRTGLGYGDRHTLLSSFDLGVVILRLWAVGLVVGIIVRCKFIPGWLGIHKLMAAIFTLEYRPQFPRQPRSRRWS